MISRSGIRVSTVVLLALLSAGGVGCTRMISGYWKLIEAHPNREFFALEDAWFETDETYRATVTIDGRSVAQQGTFSYKGDKLTLRPDAGGQQRFTARLTRGKLRVEQGERYAILKKVKPPSAAPAADE